MNLRKQLFASFLLVSILPLLFMIIYLFLSNVRLTFDLYGQDLSNSSEMQTQMVEDYVNRLMVRSGRFADSRHIQGALAVTSNQDVLNSNGVADEIQKFTDETLDTVLVFALINKDGNILYSSGSNGDAKHLKETLPNLAITDEQYVSEIPLGSKVANLAIITPIETNNEINGMFVVVFKNDFFLKTISGHKQVESSNAFLYCTEHQFIVESKRYINVSLTEFGGKLKGDQGSIFCEINGENSVVFFQNVERTPWLLVNSIPTWQIYTRVLSYGLVNLLALGIALMVIILLARRQSNHILYPLNQFLNTVDRFFRTGTAVFPDIKLDKKTEIGYLSDKFVGMAYEIVEAQDKLRESTYLYKALLHANYELRIMINYEENSVICTSSEITNRLNKYSGMGAAEQVMNVLNDMKTDHSKSSIESVGEMISGELTTPTETELCINLGPDREEVWYRIIAVPIYGGDGRAIKTALHFEDITNRKKEELRLIHSSQRDGLTGTLNKSAFDNLSRLSIRSKRGCDAVFFIDLDHFKQVNDTLGHAAGDRVLMLTADVLNAQFRTTDLVARYGGDEFVVFAPNMPIINAERKAEELVSQISFYPDNSPASKIHVTCSIGIFLSSDQEATNEMLRKADMAMYRAKQRGGAQYEIEEA